MSFQNKSVLVTGGAGTLGHALIERSIKQEWNAKITVFSTDTYKHHAIRRDFPFVNFIVGDIRDYTTVRNAMTGMDIVVHAAATKEIPTSEWNSIDTIDVNINGSLNIANAAVDTGVQHVIGISTDKACHAANAYGATKYLMEKIFQEFSRVWDTPSFHLVRYGNVLESTASVVKRWKESIARGEPIQITSEEMTRFWLSPAQAAELVEDCIRLESGVILIPKAKSLSIGELMGYTIGSKPEVGIKHIPMRPGEKMHETLLSIEETEFVSTESDGYFILRPTTTERNPDVTLPYNSQNAPRLSKDELMELLNESA